MPTIALRDGDRSQEQGPLRGSETGAAVEMRTPCTIPEQIAADLGAAIIAGDHVVGERLVETELAARFGVSRGPVRDALRILERRRLVELRPRRGAYVREVSLNSIADLFNVRLALTTSAVRIMALTRPEVPLAALRERVAELHRLAQDDTTSPIAYGYVVTRALRAIARGSGNEMLNAVLSDLANDTVWTTIWKSPLEYLSAESRRQAAVEMGAVLRAIEDGAVERAEKLLRNMQEKNRDHAIHQLGLIRGETCSPLRLVRTVTDNQE